MFGIGCRFKGKIFTLRTFKAFSLGEQGLIQQKLKRNKANYGTISFNVSSNFLPTKHALIIIGIFISHFTLYCITLIMLYFGCLLDMQSLTVLVLGDRFYLKYWNLCPFQRQCLVHSRYPVTLEEYYCPFMKEHATLETTQFNSLAFGPTEDSLAYKIDFFCLLVSLIL